MNRIIEENLKEYFLIEMNSKEENRRFLDDKYVICMLDEDNYIDLNGYRHKKEDGTRNLMNCPLIGIPTGEIENAMMYIAKNHWRTTEEFIYCTDNTFTISFKASDWLGKQGIKRTKISNGAMMAALVMCGYKLIRNWNEEEGEFYLESRIKLTRNKQISLKSL
jgi:hypothetical protein